MTSEGARLVRAAYTDDTITVCQAYSPQIAEPAVRAATFTTGFSHLDEWIVAIRDVTALAHRVEALARSGRPGEAGQLVPVERVYPVAPALAGATGAEVRPSTREELP